MQKIQLIGLRLKQSCKLYKEKLIAKMSSRVNNDV